MIHIQSQKPNAYREFPLNTGSGTMRNEPGSAKVEAR